MKKVIVLFLLLSSTFSLQAQDVAKGKELLNKMGAKYKSFSTLQADFKYTIETPAEKKKEAKSGTLSLKKEKFKLDVGDQTIFCDGKTLWTYEKDDNNTIIDNYSPKDLAINPTQIFTMYEKGYLYAYMGDETVNGKTVNQVELTPSDKKQPYFKVKLFIDKTSHLLVRAMMYYKNGTIITYDISKQSPNLTLDDNVFVFDKSKYPGVDIQDMRGTKKK